MAPTSISTSLGDLADPVARRLARFDAEDTIARIWARDHTVWANDPAEISDRLGWLDAIERSRERLGEIRSFVEDVRGSGLTHTVLLGMGGSSLGPEVVRRTFYGSSPPTFDLSVLDTTHPDAIARLEKEVPLERTLFLVSSKSGTTIETRSHLSYFHERIGSGRQFAAVTDPGTPLEREAVRLGFRKVFAAPPDVGGRYSALTVFGLVPGALAGVDPELLLTDAATTFARCLPEVPVSENPAAVLGAAMGEAALAGRDKLTVRASQIALPFGDWMEQLVAESTGKDGRGILPVIGEPTTALDGGDRIFVGLGEDLAELPSVGISFSRPADLGGQMFLWEMAVSIAGAVLGVQPFDQPNVQEAKDRTARALEAGPGDEPAGSIEELLQGVSPPDYVAIQAFVDPTAERRAQLEAIRARILERTGAATTLGIGPRYLHSTGQLHKGGPPTGVFLQILEPPSRDLPVPDRSFSFGELIAAQAAGDLAALRALSRPVARIPLADLLTWAG